MIAGPRAQIQANRSAPASGPVAQIGPASGSFSASEFEGKSARKTTPNGSLPIRRASGPPRKTSAIKPASRLSVAETTYKGKKAWRVTLGKRGKNLLSFRVRPSGSGFFVAWRSGNSERYVCYLAFGEWQAAKRGSAASFARMIAAKLDARRDAGETLDKIASLYDLVKAFA